ncbi:peptidoglycan-binding protein [Streptomyces sp. NPDC017868]|uniref:peptidoglycan-binding protein n=1 Tax=Streptomyces sp. NPDC017868 TaxID=3365014 RepID=UPI003797C5FD
MPDIEIDTSHLTEPRFTVPEAGTGPIDGSATPPPTVSLPAPGTYHLKQGSAAASDLVFSVAADGTLDFDASLDGIAEGRGTRRLTVHGLSVHLDATALDQDLTLDTGNAALTADRPHDLSLLPCPQYRLNGGYGNLTFALSVDGSIRLDPDAEGFASASGNTLTVRGCRILIDGTALSHDLLPLGLARPNEFLSRGSVNALTVLPATGYGFQPGSGIVADLQYGVSRDGQVTVGPEFAGFASVAGDTLVLRGYRIRMDGTALSHDVVPTGLVGAERFLSRGSVNGLTVLPATGYGFQPGSGIVADLQYGVSRDGQVTVGPEFAGFASVAGDTLVLRGYRIRVDGTALSHDVVPTGLVGAERFLSRGSVNALTVLPATGYGFQPGSGIVADLQYGVSRDGQVTVGPEFAGFALTVGDTLALRGYKVRIDGTALSHDLFPLGMARSDDVLPRGSVNELTLLPAAGYGFQPGPGVVADLQFEVGRDGQVGVASQFAGCASAAADTLVLHGYPVLIDATAADSDLFGLDNIFAATPGPPPFRYSNRQAEFVLLPAPGYLPRTAHGVLSRGFDLERDGTLTFPYATAGRYSAEPPTSPHPSEEGQEVTVNALVRPTDQDVPPPRGTVTFSLQQGPPLGTAELDDQGRASITTSALPLGDSVIVIDYAGGGGFVPGTTTIRHHVNPRQGEPVADAPQPEVLEWALLPTLAQMADPHAVDGHVKLAQCLLNAAGAALPPLVVDGNFGVLTLAAVRTFRAGPLLTPGDDIDTPVWFALAVAAPFPLLEAGPRIPPMTGPPVAVVQRLLNRQGTEPPLDDDGVYRPRTETAVRDFQTAHGLAATGTVTPETWAALGGPPPVPAPDGLPHSKSMRLTFSYDSADWAQGGPVVRFVSREDLDMTAPLAADPDDTPLGRAGFWYEVRDAGGRVLYRRGRHQPIAVLTEEVPGPEEGSGFDAVPLDAPRGTFELLAPVLLDGATVVLFSSPPDPGRLDEPASQIFALPLT